MAVHNSSVVRSGLASDVECNDQRKNQRVDYTK